MHTALVLETAPGVLADHLEDDLVEAVALRCLLLDHLDLELSVLGVAQVHVVEVTREEVGLLAAFGTTDLDDDVSAVVGVLGQEERLDLVLQAGRFALRAIDFGSQLVTLIGICHLEQLCGGDSVVASSLQPSIGVDDLGELLVALRQLSEQRRVSRGLR